MDSQEENISIIATVRHLMKRKDIRNAKAHVQKNLAGLLKLMKLVWLFLSFDIIFLTVFNTQNKANGYLDHKEDNKCSYAASRKTQSGIFS